MSGPRVVRPAELPRQRGHQTDRVLARPAGRPSDRETSPRPVRRAPRLDRSDIASSAVGLLATVAVLMATIAAIALVGAWWLGF